MSRVLVGIISGVGGLVIGVFGGTWATHGTFEDIKAAPGKAGSAVLGAVKKTGRKIGSGLSSLAFWKKKEVKKGKVNLKQDHMNLVAKHQNLSEKYTKLSDDFSETAKRMELVETDLADKEELLRQADEKLDTFQNTVNDQDKDLKQAVKDMKQLSDDLKIAQTTIAKLEKSTSEN